MLAPNVVSPDGDGGMSLIMLSASGIVESRSAAGVVSGCAASES